MPIVGCAHNRHHHIIKRPSKRVKRSSMAIFHKPCVPNKGDLAMATYEHPAQLLQRLIRFNTTNPPGNEAACIQYIQSVLAEVGIESTLVAKDPQRPNLIARLKGRGDAVPLLLQGHVDVVTTAHQDWKYPPFEGIEAEGYIWGRGALDMKGGVAMMLAAFARAAAEGADLPGDVNMTILSDDVVDGNYGARYLV